MFFGIKDCIYILKCKDIRLILQKQNTAFRFEDTKPYFDFYFFTLHVSGV